MSETRSAREHAREAEASRAADHLHVLIGNSVGI
jgi:hypothetical protein